MRLILHPEVYSDINRIMDYYEQAGIPQLADEFFSTRHGTVTQNFNLKSENCHWHFSNLQSRTKSANSED